MKDISLFYRLFLDPLLHGLACTIVAYLVAPTQFVKVVYQETGESYTSIISRHLRAGNYIYFFSGAHIYALRQFIAAFSFGISQWIFLCFLECCAMNNLMLLIILQCLLAGSVETIITVYSEAKEIAANKGHLMKRKGAVVDIFTPILLRNILAASAAIIAYEVTKEMDGFTMNLVITTCFGIVVSALTMPFDLIATQNCGSAVPMSWISRLSQYIFVEKNFYMIFNGLLMRILQIVPYSIAHSLVMLFLGHD